MTTRVVFKPVVVLEVEDGRIVEIDINWDDACLGVNGFGCSPSWAPDNDEVAAHDFIEDPQRQERVLNALDAQ